MVVPWQGSRAPHNDCFPKKFVLVGGHQDHASENEALAGSSTSFLPNPEVDDTFHFPK